MSDKKKTTTRDIAKACFVSQSAVSMILSGRTDMHFSRETIALVQETAAKMGYVYKPRNRRVKTDMKSTIMIMCPSLSTQYYTTLIQAITQAAQEKGLYVLIAYTDRLEEREMYYLHMAEDNAYYGIIYTFAPKAVAFLNRLYQKLPIVMINDYNPELKLELLELDSKKSGHLLARHLLHLGHRHIAYVTTPLNPAEVPRLRRLQGIKEEYERQGLSSSSVHVMEARTEKEPSTAVGNKHYETGYQLILDYFRHRKTSPGPDIFPGSPDSSARNDGGFTTDYPADSHLSGAVTAFVGTNDFVAIGIIDALKKLGYTVPGDFSVCGFDNTLVSSFSGISLPTVDHCIDEKGAQAVELVANQKKRLKDGPQKNTPLMRLEYEPQLIVRRSTGKPRSK